MAVNNSTKPIILSKGQGLGKVSPIDIQGLPILNIGLNKNSELHSPKLKSLREIEKEIEPFVNSGWHKSRVVQLLARYREAIALPGEPLGKTDLMELDLKLVEGAKPVAVQPYKIPHSKEHIMEPEIKKLLDQEVISPAVSAWASGAILVPKKD